MRWPIASRVERYLADTPLSASISCLLSRSQPRRTRGPHRAARTSWRASVEHDGGVLARCFGGHHQAIELGAGPPWHRDLGAHESHSVADDSQHDRAAILVEPASPLMSV